MVCLCRDCFETWDAATAAAAACPHCRSRRLVGHAELGALAIAHLDCDAFYASVEKRDDPSLADRPVIIGGGRRGVVAAACYVARRYGVHSAMPMFQARKACPRAVVIRPDMKKYAAAGRAIRGLMREVTPLVEPLSIDEAFLDLAGTERLHGGSAARTMAALCRRIERQVGVTASVGLSYNKFLAKLASDLDKPRGFAVIGRAEAAAFLRPRPVGDMWGVGAVMQARLAAHGITTIGHLQDRDEAGLVARYGVLGRRLARFSHGRDGRRVEPGGGRKSASAETTFNQDIADFEGLSRRLWRLCETLAARLKGQGLCAGGVVLKLKTAAFRTLTRRRRLDRPTQLAEDIYQAALPLLRRHATGTAFRLIGIGTTDFTAAESAAPGDLFDGGVRRTAKVEQAMDAVRARFGKDAIAKGRSLANDGH